MEKKAIKDHENRIQRIWEDRLWHEYNKRLIPNMALAPKQQPSSKLQYSALQADFEEEQTRIIGTKENGRAQQPPPMGEGISSDVREEKKIVPVKQS